MNNALLSRLDIYTLVTILAPTSQLRECRMVLPTDTMSPPSPIKEIFMLRIFTLLVLAVVPTIAWSQTESPAKVANKTPWIAADDLRAMEGRWRMETDFETVDDQYFPTDRHSNRIITELFVRGAVLKISKGKYAVEGSRESGRVFNQYSEIKFRPADNRWLNTEEPLISLNTTLGSKALFSYVVTPEAIHFRHPANSCSRSGIRITLKRIEDDKADQQPDEQSSAR